MSPPAAVSQPSVAIQGDARRFPVRRILCVGRNYAAHRREMGGDDRDPPFFFSKPADAVVAVRQRDPLPQRDLGLCTTRSSWWPRLAPAAPTSPWTGALALVFGYAVGVDLTRRDLQSMARDKGQPWDAAKGFDHSAPIGDDPSGRWRTAPGPYPPHRQWRRFVRTP